MATAPIVAQEAEEDIDELASALESTKETDEAALAAKEAEEVAKATEEKVAEEKAAAEKLVEEEASKEEKPEVDTKDEEIRDLRQILRESKKQMSLLQAQVQRADKKATAALDEDDETFKDDKTPIEQLSEAINAVGAERGAQLDLLAETMSEMTKYTDIYDVCNKEYFGDMFEAIGQEIAQREGLPVDQATLKAELSIWTMSNPYKYMYNLIKEHHPKFAKKEETKETDGVVKPGEKTSKAAEAPASIAGMGGSDTSKTGWTAAKIDALPEDELDKVPADIYKKYMLNNLK